MDIRKLAHELRTKLHDLRRIDAVDPERITVFASRPLLKELRKSLNGYTFDTGRLEDRLYGVVLHESVVEDAWRIVVNGEYGIGTEAAIYHLVPQLAEVEPKPSPSIDITRISLSQVHSGDVHNTLLRLDTSDGSVRFELTYEELGRLLAGQTIESPPTVKDWTGNDQD